MARPQEKGLEYWPQPVDLWEWDELHFVLAKHGFAARAILSSLLNSLFSVGYCFRWGVKDRVIFADKIRAPLELVEAVVSDAVNEGFFHFETLERHGILTAKWIQELYEAATKKRAKVEFKREWLLIKPKNSNITVLSESMPVSAPREEQKLGFPAAETSQSKVKESKGEESKDISFSEGSDPSPSGPETPPTAPPPAPPTEPQEPPDDPILAGAMAALEEPHDQPWTRSSEYMNTGRRPMKKFPELRLTGFELADVFRDWQESGIPERLAKKGFEIARSQAISKKGHGPQGCHANWLRGFVKNQLLEELIKEKRLQKMEAA